MALGSTQPLTEMSTRNISWWGGGRKVGRCVRLTTLPPSCAGCLEIWEPQPPETLWACPGLQWDGFTFTFTRFCYRLSRPQEHKAAGRIMSMKNSSDNIGNRTRGLPTCSAVPHRVSHCRVFNPLTNDN